MVLTDADGKPLAHAVSAFGAAVTFSVPVQRELEACNGRMRLFRDDDGAVLWPEMTEDENGVWSVTLSGEDVCAEHVGSGLFYFRFEFDTRFGHVIYAKKENDFGAVYKWQDENVHAFQWTVTEDGFDTPSSPLGGIMYHIFVDRFAKSEAHPDMPRRADAEYNEDWYNGIPQHAKRPGGDVKNNEFFGGNLWGAAEKMPYLQSLGVTVLYLSPIFTAYSNHKYDTGDYETVDASFGGDAAFAHLLSEAKRYGIRVICDGVFNHTGDDSRYFNRYGKYDAVGAYQSEESPYFAWYRFRNYPDDYDSWWGVKVLPALYSGNADFRNYICGEDGILHKWMSLGVSGWRLDVADELDDRFLCDLRARVKTENPEAVVWGEVWEDASNKIAYDRRRRYFRGGQLDSVMNYPFRDGILSFVKDGNAGALAHAVRMVLYHYPAGCTHLLMNLLGTHDTERIINALAAPPMGDLDNDELALIRMTEDEKARGRALVKLASVLQFTLPGIPCIYYGDEVGMEGYRDPFNRRPYPWGVEDTELLAHYRLLSRIRRSHAVFADGETRILCDGDGVFAFVRGDGDDAVTVCVNRSDREYVIEGSYLDLLTDTAYRSGVCVAPDSAVILCALK
ncbi:MAG: glycoside hydrolase family 13 protein [Clostridia bacterium]|nr:glycoside hydrolase family 13 protein [Clostridia bacterium]